MSNIFSFLRRNSGILGPLSGILILCVTAGVLIVQITLRPWADPNYAADTHLNTADPKDGYSRSVLANLGGISGDPEGWEPSHFARTSISQGYASYVGFGCASCHGLNGEGTRTGPPVAGSSLRRVENIVRQGPKGMPEYTDVHLVDADLDVIAAYLLSLPEVPETPEPVLLPTATPFPLPTATPAPTVAPSASPVPGASPTPTGIPPTPTPTREPVDSARLQSAQRLFIDVGCDICHGESAQGTAKGGPALEDLTADEIRTFVRNPERPSDSPYSEAMDPYDEMKLTPQELEEIIFFLLNN